jgi:hypothetical protein
MSLLSRIAVEAARGFGMLVSGSANNVPASYLSVAGGGAGAGSVGGVSNGGGGGAGGLLASTFTLSTLNTYSITVGAGGVTNANGSNSVVSGTGITTVTSIGGGSGGYNNVAGANGGSGGGGGAGVSIASGSGTSGQGFAGGVGFNGSNYGAGGGGGASAVGVAGTGSTGGNGGAGTASSISGSSITYAGGGGGGINTGSTAGSGGAGGGGAGGSSSPFTGTAGTVNTGGGGGGGGNGGSNTAAGGAGGSGIVIISYASATPRFIGGTLTTSGGNQIHTFTSSGTLSPLTPVTASYLVVAGGGGGGYAVGGGGGAGGLLTSSTTLYSGATYVVTVGAGGAGATSNPNRGASGSNSVLSGTGLTTLTATGGGGGGGSALGGIGIGAAGGSGGGGGGYGGANNAGGAGTSGQGFAGGTSFTPANYGAGAGGGAGAVGANGSNTAGGNGGIGVQSSISGTATYYAGGGAGNADAGGITATGGLGGGGNAVGGGAATSGTTNTGGGGGGGYVAPGAGSGGSGTVIISYAGSQVFNGGLVTSSGGNTIHTFNATGALTPLTNNLTNSLRFRASASAYLNRTPSVNGNRRTWTASFWYKNGNMATNETLFSNATASDSIGFRSGRTIEIYFGAGSANLVTTPVFRDPSAWYHIVVAVDTTQATAANRIKLYVNGNQVTAFSTATYPSQNYDTSFNQISIAQNIGRRASNSDLFLDGYMDDINWIDGQQLEPYYFGNNDANGVWKPIKYTGMYGTNGYYLTFADTTSTTTIGYDSSGNNNNWITNNINLNTPINTNTSYDAMTDVPTNTSATVANYATMNPLELGDGAPAALSNGNLTITGSASLFLRRGTINFPLTGKYYCEFTVTAVGSGVSIAYDSRGQSGATQFIQYDNGGTKNINGTTSAYGASFTTGDIVAMAVDADGGSIAFYKNNTSQGSITFSSASMTGVNATAMVFAFTSAIVNANFGQRPFSYTPPTGYVALNTFNLPTPTILQGNKYMDATLYTGNGVSQVIVNQSQFKPDLVWAKVRSSTYSHYIGDSVRGVNKMIFSNATNAETTVAGSITAFNNNGFSVGSEISTNNNTSTFVGWQWQAGQGSTTTGTGTGGITSVTQSVNTTAGFSIVTYTGSGTTGTITHGLGVAPKMIIAKGRGNVDNWPVYQASANASPATGHLLLNTTAAFTSTSTTWNNTAPTSTVFTVGTDTRINQNTIGYVAYCWAEIAGFSKFGSYVGNGSTDGTFVYTGFRPKYVLLKSTGVENWFVFDSSRNTYNVTTARLYPALSNAEDTNLNTLDLLSNGFKFRDTNVAWNGSGTTYIYACFAENPFKNANAR